MIYPTILIFAADHRTNVEWKLPFIRITDFENTISIYHDTELYTNRDTLSEVSRMIYAYKHINDFGNPEYVGFCHYKRFFSMCPVNAIVVEDKNNKFDKFILSPIDQLTFMKKNNKDGILEYPFYDVIDAEKYIDVVDMFKNYINKQKIHSYNNTKISLDIPNIVIDKWLELFKQNINDEYKNYFDNSLKNKKVYHSNIFTMKREICDIYFNLLNKLIYKIFKFVKDENIEIKNTRWCGYIIEYLYTNILFNILKNSNKYSFLHCQLLVK